MSTLPKSSTVTRSDRLEHELDVVLHQHERGAALLAHPAQRLAELLGLVHVETRRRLVEQHHGGLGRQRPGDLEQPPGAERHRQRGPVGDRVEPEQLEDVVDRLVLAGTRSLAEAAEVADDAEQLLASVLHAAGDARGARAR